MPQKELRNGKATCVRAQEHLPPVTAPVADIGSSNASEPSSGQRARNHARSLAGPVSTDLDNAHHARLCKEPDS